MSKWSTPEGKAYRREYRSRPDVKEKQRKYNSTPEGRERQRIANAKPEAIERRRKYRESAEIKDKVRKRRQSPEGKETYREWERKKRYGLQPGEWKAMFDAQECKCGICGSLEHGGRHWHTDHCHATGKVRGILCHSCNHLLGGAKDKVEILIKAIGYLQATKAD